MNNLVLSILYFSISFGVIVLAVIAIAVIDGIRERAKGKDSDAR